VSARADFFGVRVTDFFAGGVLVFCAAFFAAVFEAMSPPLSFSSFCISIILIAPGMRIVCHRRSS
jgi:hypothetical protein